MLDNPDQRAAAARRIVSASDVENPLDERDHLARSIISHDTVQLRIPVRSVPELKRLLHEIALECRSIAADLGNEGGGPKRSDTAMLGGAWVRLGELRRRLHYTNQGHAPIPRGRPRLK